jgi:signal peptidase
VTSAARGRRLGGVLRRCLTALVWLALAVAAIALVASTALAVLRLEPTVVLSGSMRPTFEAGDLVLVKRTTADTVKPGEVITFRNPAAEDRSTITHRVIRVRRNTRGVPGVPPNHIQFQTKGDANNHGETWSIKPDGIVGRIEGHVPSVGKLAHYGFLGPSRPLLIAAVCMFGLVLIIRWIWQDDPEAKLADLLAAIPPPPPASPPGA